MAYQDNLIATRDQIAARLVEITAQPKPSYSVDGESYSWSEYFQALANQLKGLNELIQQADGPWEFRTKGI